MALSLGIPRMHADTATLTLSASAKFGTSSGSTLTQNNVTWTLTSTNSGAIQNSYNTSYKGQQIGTSKSPWTGSFSTDGIAGTVTQVKVTCATGGSATIGVKVGGTDFVTGASSATTASATKTSTAYTFTGSASGKVELDVTNTAAAFYLGIIEVTYSIGGGDETDVAAPVFSMNGTAISGSSVEVDAGTEITAATATAGATVTLEADPASAALISGSTATISAACTLTATATLNGKTVSSNLQVALNQTPPNPPAGDKATVRYYVSDANKSTVSGVENAQVTNKDGSTSNSNTSDAKSLNGKEIGSDAGVTVKFAKGTTNSLPTAWTDGTMRLYTNGTFTVTVKDGYKITNIQLSTDKTNISDDILGKKQASTTFDFDYSGLETQPTTVKFTVSATTKVNYIEVTVAADKVATPTFSVNDGATTETVDGVLYYTNPITVSIDCSTPDAVIFYGTSGEPENLTLQYSGAFAVNADATYYAKAIHSTLPESSVAQADYKFRTATPVIACSDPDDAQSKTVSITAATNGSTIEYSTDGGATWQPYSGSITFDSEGTVNILARAVSSFGSSTIAESHVSIYPVMKWQPFQLVTDVTTLVPGDEVIFVAAGYDMALKPYVDNDMNCKAEAIVKSDDKATVRLDPSSAAVGIYTIEKTADGNFRFKSVLKDNMGGYLTAVAGDENRLHTHTLDKIPADPVHSMDASVVVSPQGIATVTFIGEGITHNLLRYYHGASKLFSCYGDKTGSTYDIGIYRRGAAAEYAPRPTATPAEGVYEKDELTEVTLQCLDASGNAVDDPTLNIYYTTDGSDPRKGGKRYTGAIPVAGNITVRAYATRDGYFDSPSLIANYTIFEPGRQYRRVTSAEIPFLKVTDDIIILGSPSGSEDVYALSRKQIGDGIEAFRDAIKLPDAVASDGRITINDKNVQVLTLLDGADYYEAGYDWRLYASGSDLGADKNSDGFLLAEGNNNALQTIRIDTPASDRLPNADVHFHSADDVKGYGNEYGGVTVHFGSADGHEADWPKLMALSNVAGAYRFDVRKESDFTSGSYHVSIFKIFNPNELYAPVFTLLERNVATDTPIEISQANLMEHPATKIWYSLDEGATWQLYTEPFTIGTEGDHTVWARAQNASLEGADAEGYSAITKHTYTVTDEEVYELVTDASTLKENDRVIIVNAVKHINPKDKNPQTGWYTPADFDSGNGRFNSYELTMLAGTDELPTQFLLPSESNAQIFRLQYDTSASDPNRPWLFYLGADDAGNDKYVRSAAAKKFELVGLPESIEGRKYLNAGIEIFDDKDYAQYYNEAGNLAGGDKVELPTLASITFNGVSVANYVRFNPAGGLRFRGYNNGGQGNPSPSTWPVRIYRAQKRVLPPTVTVYDENKEQAFETDITTFNNPVRVVIKHHPKTDRGTDLLYSWSKSLENAPVLSEYLNAVPKEADEIELLVDGNSIKMLVDGLDTEIDELPSIEGIHVLRAIAVNGIDASPSTPRIVEFKCTKPLLAKGDGDYLDVTNPSVYTKGAALYFSYDDEAVVEDDAHKVTDGKIPMAGHSKINVQAFKEGYAPSDVAVYTPMTVTPHAHAVQLLELTDEGRANFAGLLESGEDFLNAADKVYVTYRTISDGQFYAVKEDASGNITMDGVTDNAAARRLIDYLPAKASDAGVNVLWTTDYYVYVLNEADFLSVVGGDDITSYNVSANIYVNGSSDAIPTQASAFKVNGKDVTYHGTVLHRQGAIGTIMLRSVLEYDIQEESGSSAHYSESAEDQITPLIPSVYGGWYAFKYSQEPQDLTSQYSGEFLKFNVESKVRNDADGKPAVSEVLIPTADIDPRHLDAVITFHRPNVSKEILDRNDIYYTVYFTSTSGSVEGSGVYVDRTDSEYSAGTVIPELYQFTVKNISPRSLIYPRLEVVATEYVETLSEDGNYGRFTSNHGDNILVEAKNDPYLNTGGISKIHLGPLHPGQSDCHGNKNTTSGYHWLYRGHNELTPPEEIVHDPADNTEESIRIAPVYYHIEVTSSNPAEYASYEYLVKHVPGHNNADTPPLDFDRHGNFVTDDTDDPLLGTYLATGFTSRTDVTVSLTPVYIFSRQPDASSDGVEGNVITPLDKVQSATPPRVVAPVEAPAVRAKAADAVVVGGEKAAPVIGEQRPMRHYGLTDMAAANITDLTAADAPFDVIPGNPITRTLSDQEVTGVDNVAVDSNDAEVEYYNLQGQRIARPDHGVVIERRGSQARKIVL